MKKMQLIVTAAALLLMAGTAMAAGNTTLDVSATVQASCSIGGPGTLSFGVLDPILAPAATANSAGITITCTNGTGYTVTPASAQGGVMKASLTADTFAYSLVLPGGGTGTGTGAAVPFTVTGNIAAGAYSGKPADLYSDVVTLSIVP
jgi:spore coat protein U-like protein